MRGALEGAAESPPAERVAGEHDNSRNDAERCCGEYCVCRRRLAAERARSDPASPPSPPHFVEVEHEPYHVEFARTPLVRVYAALVPRGCRTLYHRHVRDTLYLALKTVTVRNEKCCRSEQGREEEEEDGGSGDETLASSACSFSSFIHRAERGDMFCRLHESDRAPLIHRVCNDVVDGDDGDGARGSCHRVTARDEREDDGSTAFFAVEFLQYPPPSPPSLDSDTFLARLSTLAEQPALPRARIHRVARAPSASSSCRAPFHGILVHMRHSDDALPLAQRFSLFAAGEAVQSTTATALPLDALVIELLPRASTRTAQ